ncbi:MAG: hypothetical protein A2W52_00865 [Candidatus Taylorbacteria bacterium RIFCSPHIGHO2_02_49_25]|uniref:DUF3198 domain-containing protein n=1 Tax=Candidatus Taylorbacteria bacterium RIFCSPHIGHO2_02_49_25 TaxID=1802305 RepID=A0A1G2MB29_9BACT|nr:MAG: hypothetical protein UY62_C0017G0027 [Parcubacteria group bacterium GW2011_GWF2_50_9]OHA19990.1 MAG: hypothetical protein A2759_00140 [Candidatus Taylorbacteria bacterium RIFCSPHIGHO2_01_FULL_49_60]OHA20934.1 MAG: hypothetical protein A2W52_00865 [Candidatus Taylorbacteria bacterium RIFCSPHIGHO2_02_49_25]OHA36093.1 MAG: hypothetical protein A3B27_03385 [Candidatus Taylorbacteria bacterium RIFCSPLOWO2_01_FULL_50_130]OHA37233.1 MAG: hypothetical protein A2W65_03110 [Candidatus Taylorbacte
MKFIKFFDKLEDTARGKLSRVPIIYGIIGGIAIVLFWRGIWHTADMFEGSGGILAILFGAPISTILSAVVLLLTGLFVSFFIGDRIILSGLTHEKKVEEKTESEVRAEGAILLGMFDKLERIEKEIEELKKDK